MSPEHVFTAAHLAEAKRRAREMIMNSLIEVYGEEYGVAIYVNTNHIVETGIAYGMTALSEVLNEVLTEADDAT